MFAIPLSFFSVRTQTARRNQGGHDRQGPPPDPMDVPLESAHRGERGGPPHRRGADRHRRTVRRREEQTAPEGGQEEGAGRPGHRVPYLGRPVYLFGAPDLEHSELSAGECNQRPRAVRGPGQLEDAPGGGVVRRQHHRGNHQQVIGRGVSEFLIEIPEVLIKKIASEWTN